MSEPRFDCTPGGDVRDGRRRLRNILAGLFFSTLLVAAITAWTGNIGSAFICFLASLMPALAWRMIGDVDLLWVELRPSEMTVRMRGQLSRLPLEGATARQLEQPEIEHLRNLASHGPIVAHTGSYESSRLGALDLYATQLENAVIVSGEERQIVITPDDVDGFLTAFDKRPEAPVAEVDPLLQSTAHE